MRRNGLKKYDAPLKIQYQWGYQAFNKGGVFKKIGKQSVFVENRPYMDEHTMQYREWQRGWNAAYFENLEKLNEYGAKT
jgi:hypothetical protein